MAWEFNNGMWVRKGILDNTIEGKARGNIALAGIGMVVLDLIGNMEGRLHGTRLRFYEPNYNAESRSGENATASIALDDYGRWDRDGKVSNAVKERKIEGRIHFIKLSDDLNGCVMIEYFNTRSNKPNQDSDNLSVIHYVPYEITTH